MTLTPKVLYDSTVLSSTVNSETVLYTATALTGVDCCTFFNYTAASVTLKVWIVPSGGDFTTPDEYKRIPAPYSLPPYSGCDLASLIDLLETGDMIVGLSGTATAISSRAVGLEIT